MSFNVGDGNSKYVHVYDVTMNFSFSEKVLFASFSTSRKTGKPLVDVDTGAIVLDEEGNPKPERVFERWDGRFVGNALEPAKALTNSQAINILNGWLEKKQYKARDGSLRDSIYIVVSDFEVCDQIQDTGEDDPSLDSIAGTANKSGGAEQ